MANSAATFDFVEELLEMRPGRVRSIIGADVDRFQKWVEARAPAICRPLRLKRPETIPTSSRLIGDVVHALATTARSLWPVWFSDVDFGLGRSATDRAAAQLRVAT